MNEKYAVMALFGGALALFCWRFAAVQRADIPASVTQDDVPDMPVPLAFAPAELVVGMSYTPGPPLDVPAYRANMPPVRPMMGPPPSAAK